MKKTFATCIAAIFIYYAIQYWPVTVHICGSSPESNFSIRMPFKDKRNLEYFFRDACFVQGWAYTMMGSKPMSTFQYIQPWVRVKGALKHPELKHFILSAFWPPNIGRIYWLFDPVQLKIKQGCETLNRYLNHFPNSRLAFFCTSDQETVGLLIVNKPNLIKTVRQNLEDFEETLQTMGITPEDLSKNENIDVFLKNLDHDNECIRGTILGFGRGNGWLYDKYSKMDLTEFPMEFIWSKEDHEKWVENTNEKEASFRSWDPSDLFYPCFICDPQSEETQQLKQSYREDREKIIKYFEGKDIVEAALSSFS